MSLYKIIFLFFLLGASHLWAKNYELPGYPDRPIIEKPANSPSKNLVILLHPVDTSARFIGSYYPLARYRHKHSFNLIIPSGKKNERTGKRYWAAGAACCDHDREGTDDIKFLDKLIKHYKLKYQSQNIYLVGHSNGAFLAQHYACYGKEPISGIYSFAGNPSSNLKDCRELKNIKVVLAHGPKDTYVPYYGAKLRKGGHYSIPVSTYLNDYQIALGCSNMEFKEKKDYTINRLGKDFDIYQSLDCEKSNQLIFWDHFNGGHIPRYWSHYYKDIITTLLK